MATSKEEKKLTDEDIEFVSSLSQAALEKPTFKSQIIVWVVLALLVTFIFWAKNTELDKIIRGEGTVVPSGQVRIIQNFEGGIVDEILVRSGDSVTYNQLLLKLDNTQFASRFGEAQDQESDLFAQSVRLRAEAFNEPFNYDKSTSDSERLAALKREEQLFHNRKRQLKTSQNVFDERIIQNRNQLKEARSQVEHLGRSLSLLEQEIGFMKDGVRQGYASQVDLLKLQRESNEIQTQIMSTEHSIPRLQSLIAEARNKRTEDKQAFQNEANQRLNEVLAQLEQIASSKIALADKVKRTKIRSPVNGIISELLVNTLGEVVKPGSDIVKIVPKDDTLVIKTKILPADIGFIFPGLKAKVKFTAYDFAVFGGLDGTVERISANTQTDADGNSFFIAQIKTQRNYLGTEDRPLVLLPGMVATVDVIVGKHSVMDYLVKPILRTKELALRES